MLVCCVQKATANVIDLSVHNIIDRSVHNVASFKRTCSINMLHASQWGQKEHVGMETIRSANTLIASSVFMDIVTAENEQHVNINTSFS